MRGETMNVQKRTGGAIHTGYEYTTAGTYFLSSACGAGRSHNRGNGAESRTWAKTDAPVTCKRCIKNAGTEQPATHSADASDAVKELPYGTAVEVRLTTGETVTGKLTAIRPHGIVLRDRNYWVDYDRIASFQYRDIATGNWTESAPTGAQAPKAEAGRFARKLQQDIGLSW
jgi:hypothetical protein